MVDRPAAVVRRGAPMQVIFNADDFGRSSEINGAVVQAHREGVLTSASLMVAADAVEEAVALARETPSLAVGLHLVLSDGRPASPLGRVGHLVDRAGRFPANPARVWIRYIFSTVARAEMAVEVRAQFERFAATGLPLDHVDAHQHLHMHPAVFATLLPLAEQFGACGVRLPRDDLRLAMRHDRRGALVKALWAGVFGILSRRYARDVADGSLALSVADRVYGLMQTGRMEEAYVLRVLGEATGAFPPQPVVPSGPGPGRPHPLRRSDWGAGVSGSASDTPRRRRPGEESHVARPGDASPVPRRGPTRLADPRDPSRTTVQGTTPGVGHGSAATPAQLASPARGEKGRWAIELYFHPSLAPQVEPWGPNPGDLATLLSPAVRQAVEACGWTPATYSTLAEAV
jgi:hopanoid biosynthesis associated protein HpnK